MRLQNTRYIPGKNKNQRLVFRYGSLEDRDIKSHLSSWKRVGPTILYSTARFVENRTFYLLIIVKNSFVFAYVSSIFIIHIIALLFLLNVESKKERKAYRKLQL